MRYIFTILPLIAGGLFLVYIPTGESLLLHLSWMIMVIYLFWLIASKPLPDSKDKFQSSFPDNAEEMIFMVIGINGYDRIDKSPITAREYARGLEDLKSWLNEFVKSGNGEMNVRMNTGEIWQPKKLLKEIEDQTDAGIRNLEMFIFSYRSNWKEHYSDEEWQKAKTIFLLEFQDLSAQQLDEVMPCSCGKHNTSIRQIIESVHDDTPEGEQLVVSTIELERI